MPASRSAASLSESSVEVCAAYIETALGILRNIRVERSRRQQPASPHAVSSFYPDKVFYVYVLRSESDSGFYTGFSTDLKRRLAEHTRGASFATKSRSPWKLIYYEA